MTSGSDSELCAGCVANHGLCARHEISVLPQLAVNLGWLRLMGEVHTEQRRLQKATVPDTVQLARIERRNARRGARRGLRGLVVHIQTVAA